MNQNLTDLTVIVDRSGSMVSCLVEAQGGLNDFIEKQKAVPGECTFTLVQFDTEYEFVHKGVPIKSVGHFTLQPRGFTALLDAVGKAIIETGKRLSDLPEPERPGLVVVCIVTDGGENASKEFVKAKIREMIEHQQGVYKWQFTFLAANQDAFAEGGSMGISAVGTANYSVANTRQAYAATNAKVCRMRGATQQGLAPDNSFTDEEVKQMA